MRTAQEVKNFIKASYENTPPEMVNGFYLDKEISAPTALVYTDGTSAVVIHRGTKSGDDWKNNLAYFAGMYEKTKRFKTGKKVQQDAERKYGSNNVSTVSHSQGSIIARKVGEKSKEIINVNPAWLGERQKANEYNIRSDADIISGFYQPYKQATDLLYPKYSKKHNISIPAENTLDVLGEHNSNVLDRLGEKQIGGSGIKPKVALLKHPALQSNPLSSNFHFRFQKIRKSKQDI